MKKYILDTSVLLHDFDSIYSFEGNKVIISTQVLLEVDKKRGSSGQVGKNARRVITNLKDLLQKNRDKVEIHKKSISVELNNDSILHLYLNSDTFLSSSNNFLELNNIEKYITDLNIIKIAELESGILVTNDFTMQIIAWMHGIDVEEYKSDNPQRTLFYNGTKDVTVVSTLIDELYQKESLKIDRLKGYVVESEIKENQFINLISTSSSALTIFKKGYLNLINTNYNIQGISPKNKEQIYALNALLDPAIELVTLQGPSGTGKTLLSLVAGLEQVDLDSTYTKLLVGRPIVSMGNDLGYMPGDKEEKLRPWMQAIYDNIDFIAKDGDGYIEGLKQFNKFEIEALQYIRGRSIPNQFIIIDEAQNLSPKEIKTVITRAGDGSKIVLTGDTDQIDAAYLSKKSNAISHVKESFVGQNNYAHIKLNKTERSRLAGQGSKLL